MRGLLQTRRQPAFPDDDDDHNDDDDNDWDGEDDDYKSCSFALIPSGKRLSQNFISIRLTLINDCFTSLTHTHTKTLLDYVCVALIYVVVESLATLLCWHSNNFHGEQQPT